MVGLALLPWGQIMSGEMGDADALVLSAAVWADREGEPVSVFDLAEALGDGEDEVRRSIARLRARGCLTKQGRVNWHGMSHGDLLALARAVHQELMQPLADLFGCWMDAHPGRFEGFEAQAVFGADGDGPLQ